MRGTDQQQNHVFSYISPEQRVRSDHPLRPIRTMVDEILKKLSPQFNKMYSKVGRTVDSSGAVVARAAVADVVFGAQRAALDGRDGLQHFVSLVCGVEFG